MVTPQAGSVGGLSATNTSMDPSSSRTSSRGNGSRAIGSRWPRTSPVGENEVE
jgi:hypothetical protein